MALIELRRISKTYGARPVLHDVSLSIVTIGLIGYVLDRLMGVVERRVQAV